MQTINHLLTDWASLKDEFQAPVVPDDDESWLDVTAEEVDKLLKGAEQFDDQSSELMEDTHVTSLTQLVNNMKDFLESESSYEGVEHKRY